MDKGEKNRYEGRVIKEGERKGKKNEIRVIGRESRMEMRNNGDKEGRAGWKGETRGER